MARRWTVTFVVTLAILGIPPVVALAWVFDVTPHGVERTQWREPLRSQDSPAPGGDSPVPFATAR